MENTQTFNIAAPAPHHEEWHSPHGHLIREVVFGANDGLVTLIGFLAGVTGALSSNHPIILAGVALIIAGSMSMGIGAYLSSKAQSEYFKNEIARERWEIQTMPDVETAEVRDHYSKMGFSESETEMIVKRITSNPELWLRFMMHEELGLAEDKFENPIISGLVVGAAYFIASWVPLLPYFFIKDIPLALVTATALAVGSMVVMGYFKAKLGGTSFWKSSLEMAILGTLAGVIGYVGSWLAASVLPQ